MSYYINYIATSHIGKKRTINQDSVVCNNKLVFGKYANESQQSSGYISNKNTAIFGVFDGMGGLSHGEIASSLAAKSATEFEFGNHVLCKLNDYCTKANQEIYDYSKLNNLGAVGTTAAMLVFSKYEISLCNIGDSKIFRFENGLMEKISKDHVTKCPVSNRGLLTQNLGISEKEMKITPYFAKGGYQVGDIYMICSDGLTDMVSESRIQEIVFSLPFENTCQSLLDEALDNGGQDNISIILCRIEKKSLFELGKDMFKWKTY